MTSYNFPRLINRSVAGWLTLTEGLDSAEGSRGAVVVSNVMLDLIIALSSAYFYFGF